MTSGIFLVIVRINAVDTPWHSANIAALRGLPDVVVMLPKSEDAAEVAAVVFTLKGRLVIALIETAKGFGQRPHHCST